MPRSDWSLLLILVACENRDPHALKASRGCHATSASSEWPRYLTFPGGNWYSSRAVARSASDSSFTRTFGVMMFAVSVV